MLLELLILQASLSLSICQAGNSQNEPDELKNKQKDKKGEKPGAGGGDAHIYEPVTQSINSEERNLPPARGPVPKSNV